MRDKLYIRKIAAINKAAHCRSCTHIGSVVVANERVKKVAASRDESFVRNVFAALFFDLRRDLQDETLIRICSVTPRTRFTRNRLGADAQIVGDEELRRTWQRQLIAEA